MHYNSDVPNFRFSETPKPASVIPAPGSAGEIYSNNVEVFVSVWNRNRRSSESQGNYSASIGVEMIDLELWSVKIEVDCQRSDDSWDVIQGDGAQIFHFKNSHHSIEIPWDEYFLGSAVVKITAMDGVGNKASMEEEWYGVVQTMWNEFMKFMREMWEKALDAALSLGNVVYEWVKGEIESRFGDSLDSIAAGLDRYINGIEETMEEFFSEINDFDWNGTQNVPDDFDVNIQREEILVSGLALILSFIGLQNYAATLMNGIRQIMAFLEPFSYIINPMEVSEIIISIIKSKMDFGNNYNINELFVVAKSGTENIIDKMLSILPEFQNTPGGNFPSHNAIFNFVFNSDFVVGGIIEPIWNNLKILIEDSDSSTRSISSGLNILIGILIIVSILTSVTSVEAGTKLAKLSGVLGLAISIISIVYLSRDNEIGAFICELWAFIINLLCFDGEPLSIICTVVTGVIYFGHAWILCTTGFKKHPSLDDDSPP